ncbi:TonB-dependent copper receptor [Paraburkholderia lycopersici]|uniref:Iron complex outermembrane recepter protein n=1 Tax=Paraburkholderia lycopersici TaxID=416944 RepID=A0A1G6GLR8_9BURK|nr:TonB-dependent copper receptor [Paraburkholderia lycopersici]SDB82972.1 iron complex outermembrane recepter protein [Paraburkholderia lycopersici]
MLIYIAFLRAARVRAAVASRFPFPSRIAQAALFALASGAAICTSIAARAAEPAGGDAADTTSATAAASVMLPTVEVVASPLANSLVSVTDPKTPRQPMPASDGADYLKTVPGFTAIRSGGTNGDPVLRGMFGSRVNLLANGAPTQGACPARMDAPTSYVAPESYDKVTVIKGPQTVLYGPGASAGTVLFERDTPRFDTTGARVDASVMGGSNGRNDENLELAAGTPDVYARVNANKSHAQDYTDGNGKRVPSAWGKWNADVALGAIPDADTKLELTAGTGNGDARYAGRGMDGVRFRRDSVGLRFEKKNIGEVFKRIEAQVFYNEADHRMDNYTLRTPATGSMPMASDVRRRTVGGRVAATFEPGDRLQWVVGMDAQSNGLDSRSAMGLQSPSSLPWSASATLSDYGLFSELTWDATDRQRVVAGARIDRAAATDERASMSGSMGLMPMPNPTHDDTRARVLPGGFVRYEQTLRALPLTWYAGLGHVERFPDYWELFSPTRGPAGATNAFTGVEPEKTTQLDIGAHYRGGSVDAWLSAYAGYVDDFILFTYGSGANANASQATNVNAQIMGGELGATWRPRPGWKLGVSAAYAWGRNVDTGQPLPQIPPLDVRLSADYAWRGWSAGGLWRLVAPQRRYALHEGNVVGQDFGPSAGFAVVSVHAQYDVDKHTQLSLGIDNLFDKAYSEHLNLAGNAGFGYPGGTPLMEPGRTVWGRVRFRM